MPDDNGPPSRDLPAPLNDASCDLRGFRWMKLDITALLNSDFNMTGDDTAWRAGVTLWLRAWHQVPAGSLPANELTLCNLAGFARDMKSWRRIRDTALHGFVLCSDGRLYHGYLCKLAKDAIQEKGRFERRKAADRDRKRVGQQVDAETNSTGIPPEPTQEFQPTGDGIPTENGGAERSGAEKTGKEERKEESVTAPSAQQRTMLMGVTGGCTPVAAGRSTEVEKPADKRGTRLQVNWYPSQSSWEFCVSKGVDPSLALEEFVGYWPAVPGQKGLKLDWDLTFKNRVRELALQRKYLVPEKKKLHLL